MFGEKEIVGHTIAQIKNGKIILPNWTSSEPGEEICAMLDPYQKRIMLMKEQELLRTIYSYMDLADEARRQGKITYTEHLNYQRYFFGILPLRERKLNKKIEYQIFSKNKDEDLNMKRLRRLNLKDKVYLVGAGKQLHIYPSEEQYHEYQKEYVPRDKTQRKV